MPAFRPDLLSPSTLKALAKAARKAAPEVLGHPIATHESQELIARILGQPDWHAALAVANEHAQTMDAKDDNAPTAFFPPTMVLRTSAENDSALAVNMLVRFLQPVKELEVGQELSRIESESLFYLPHLAEHARTLARVLATGDTRRMEMTLLGMLLTVDQTLAPSFDKILAWGGSWKDALDALGPQLPLLPSDIGQLRAVIGQKTPPWKAQHWIALIEDLSVNALAGGDNALTWNVLRKHPLALEKAGQPVPLFFSLIADRLENTGHQNVHDVFRGWTHLMAQQAPIFALSLQTALDHGHHRQNLMGALSWFQRSGAMPRSHEHPTLFQRSGPMTRPHEHPTEQLAEAPTRVRRIRRSS